VNDQSAFRSSSQSGHMRTASRSQGILRTPPLRGAVESHRRKRPRQAWVSTTKQQIQNTVDHRNLHVGNARQPPFWQNAAQDG
jgi:hypothetical protein